MRTLSSNRFLQIVISISVLTLLFFFWSDSVYAAGTSGSTDLGQVAKNVTSTFKSVAKMITASAYIAGLGFAMGAILKFKQHKDNPTQLPIGTPIAMLFIAAALIFLPTIFGVTGQTLFGGSQTVGGPSGVVYSGK
ncbi:MAG: type IV secretion protein IcmD [Proteobacteria bacterium]|nr:type IV secretion protein IcmD [Pseudomonadota bacterium]